MDKENKNSIRLDQQTVWELEILKKTLGNSRCTDMIVEAIHTLYRINSEKGLESSPFDALEAMGFIGAVEGEADDSTTYKETHSLRMKHS